MSVTQSNERLNNIVAGGNSGKIATGFNPSIIVGAIIAPLGFSFTPANMLSQSAFITAVNALTQNDTRANRGFPFFGLDDFKDETKEATNEDTGIYQLNVLNFPAKFSFRFKTTQANINNYQELTSWNDNAQFGYGIYFVDQQGATWGYLDPAGTGNILPFSMAQFWVPNWGQKMASKNTAYRFMVALSSQQQMNANFAYFVCPTLDANNLVGLENVVLYQAPSAVLAALATATIYTASTDIVVLGKMGQDSADFMQVFGPSITAACFVSNDTTSSTTLTVASIHNGGISVAGIFYYYTCVTLSAAPTATHVVNCGIAAPSVFNGVIANANVVCENLQPNVDGNRRAVKTF